MERAFDFNQNIPQQSKILDTPVQLHNLHLIIQHELANRLIGEEMQAYAAMMPEAKKILLTKASNIAFKAKYKPIMLFVKQKNTHGDKSISLQEFFADHPDLSQDNQALKFSFEDKEAILEIHII
ncbi:hypothetical protein [Cecembia rubra]|uniref:Uncharacterized protein n=1 Tax=Cecembia rubra TaxID=1485585 RepID=A0A2P8E305_9BACT|nr:hypothetical protein [Cecembia rubra]PSL03858.1 hypothetical protein CLV48_10698 [Cecembia rubra]